MSLQCFSVLDIVNVSGKRSLILVYKIYNHISYRALHSVRTHLVEGVKSPIHFYCVLHAKRGEGVQIACKMYIYILG